MTSPPARWPTALVALGCMALGVWMRLPQIGRGYTADELALIHPGWSPSAILADVETTVNPPWIIVLASLLEPAQALAWGRWAALLASISAVGLAAWAGSRGARGAWLGGLLAGVVIATSPIAIDQAAQLRAYPFWLAIACWHLGALVRWLDAPAPSRAASASLALSALLLPQLHYFSVPILLAEAALVAWVRPRGLWLWLPAALAFSPLALRILTDHARMQSVGFAPLLSLRNVMGMGYYAHGVWLVATILLFALLGSRRLGRGGWGVLAGLLGVVLGTLWLGSYQRIRPTAATFTLPYVAVLAATLPAHLIQLPASLSRQLSTSAAWLGLAWLLLHPAPERLQLEVYPPKVNDGVWSFARALSANEVPLTKPAEIWVVPAYALHPLRFYLTGDVLARCDDRPGCFESAHGPILGADTLEDVPPTATVVVALGHGLLPSLPSYTLLHQGPGYRAYQPH